MDEALLPLVSSPRFWQAGDILSQDRAGIGQFHTAHWSTVLQAGDGTDSQAASALEKLCRTHWYPFYAYVRRQGRAPDEAQDLTQAFFAQLLARGSLGTVSREKGRFRSFLLTAMNHFLADEWDRWMGYIFFPLAPTLIGTPKLFVGGEESFGCVRPNRYRPRRG